MDKKILLIGLFIIMGTVFVSGCIGESNTSSFGSDDVDGDGKLSQEELEDAADKAGVDLNDPSGDYFDMADRDGDGKLSEDEI